MHSLHLSPSFSNEGQRHWLKAVPHFVKESLAIFTHDFGQRQRARMSCTVCGSSFSESLNLPVHVAHCAPCSIHAEQPQNTSVEFAQLDNSSLMAEQEQL